MPPIALRENTRVIQRPWSGRPRHPFAVNRDSEQFQGLVAWWPCMPFVDLIDMGPSGRFRLARNGPVWVADAEMGTVPLFDDGLSQHFSMDVAAVTAYPWTLVGWGLSDDTTKDQTLISIADSTVDNQRIDLALNGNNAGDPVALCVQAGAASSCVSTTTGYSADTWTHCCGVGVSATDRAIFKDGGSKGTTTANRNPTGLNRTRIGASGGPSTFSPLSGRAADARIYNRALTNSEVYRQWHPNTRWDLYYPLGRKTYVFFPSAGQLFTQTIDDTALASDEYVKQQQMGQADDSPMQEAFVKTLHKVVSENADMLDAIVSAIVRQLVASDAADVDETISKILQVLKDEAHAVSDDILTDIIEALVEVCGPTYGLTDEAAVSLILHRRLDDTAEISDLLTKVLHAVKDDTQEISDSVLTEIIGAVVVLLTLDDALIVMDEFIRHQHAQQGDDADFQEAITKALHKITDDGVLDVTDETVSAVIRYLLAQDTEDAADLILKVVHAIRDENAAMSDEFTRQQQAGHEDTQAQEDAFTKVLHAIKSDDQHVSDEAPAILVKILLAQDTTEMNDLITKALRALKADDAIVADEFTRHQQAGVTDDQAAQDAFVKVLHTLKTEDQAASDEALLAAIKYLLASEEIDLEDFVTKILHAVKAEDQAASDVFEKQQRAVLEDSQQAEDTVVKILAKIAEDDQALTDLIVGTLHKLLGDDADLPDEFVKHLSKVVSDSQEVTDDITAAIVARLVQLLLDDTANASDEALKQLRKTVAEDQSALDDIVTQITGLTLLVIDEALHAADEVLKAIHNVTDETGYIISDQAALQRVVEAVISERQEAADEFLKVASMVFGDEQAAAEALVKAVLKVLADGPVDITDVVTAEIVELVTVGFIQAMLSGVNDPQHKTSGIGREPRLTAGVNDPQGKESGIARSPRLTSAIRDLMRIVSDIKGTRK